jgi:hypothetical protein
LFSKRFKLDVDESYKHNNQRTPKNARAKETVDVNPQILKFIFSKIIIIKFVFLGGLQSLKYVRNLTSTRKQKQKSKITKERNIKSKTSKKLKK